VYERDLCGQRACVGACMSRVLVPVFARVCVRGRCCGPPCRPCSLEATLEAASTRTGGSRCAYLADRADGISGSPRGDANIARERERDIPRADVRFSDLLSSICSPCLRNCGTCYLVVVYVYIFFLCIYIRQSMLS